jgi:16S rRNA (cytosine1402-N4)-methyltransferase
VAEDTGERDRALLRAVHDVGIEMMTLAQPNQPRSAAPGHAPVMLAEALVGLAIRPGGRYIDATFGGGGHTSAILAQSAPDGRVLALDTDPEATARAERLAASLNVPDRLTFVQTNFAGIDDAARSAGFPAVDGVLFDFGLSSFQLDDPGRGFAFRFEGPLDMRMNPDAGESVSDLLATIGEPELTAILRRYGEEPRARQIARAIVAERDREPIETTGQLASLVERAVGGRRGAKIHPATKTFQALRIAVNDELGAIERGMVDAIGLLAPGGRLVTIAFHSLEDRLAKSIIAAESATCVCPPELPVCRCGAEPRVRRVGGSRKPAGEEIAHNPRARSAIMRVAERLPGGKRADREVR